WVSKE
ncbi:hypothetical protein D047_2365B, partial [Vibrio parahaemolyticus VPTS-2010_2]